MISMKTLADVVMQQHTSAVERVIREVSIALERAGVWAPELGRLLHDFVKTTTRKGPGVTTMISIKRSSRWEAVGYVKTVLDGNSWRTVTVWNPGENPNPLPPEPSSGGSALYGSPQDAMSSEICQLPLPFEEGHRLGWPYRREDSVDVVFLGTGSRQVITGDIVRICENCGTVLFDGQLSRDCRCRDAPGHGAG